MGWIDQRVEKTLPPLAKLAKLQLLALLLLVFLTDGGEWGINSVRAAE